MNILKDKLNPTDLLTYNETQSAAAKSTLFSVSLFRQLAWPVSVAAPMTENSQSAVYPQQFVMSSTSGWGQSIRHFCRGFSAGKSHPCPFTLPYFSKPAT